MSAFRLDLPNPIFNCVIRPTLQRGCHSPVIRPVPLQWQPWQMNWLTNRQIAGYRRSRRGRGRGTRAWYCQRHKSMARTGGRLGPVDQYYVLHSLGPSLPISKACRTRKLMPNKHLSRTGDQKQTGKPKTENRKTEWETSKFCTCC